MRLRHSLKYLLAFVLSACDWHKTLDPAELSALYTQPLPPPDKPLRVFHIGHSLVNKDVPMLLEQLAGKGHDHRSQLGWGASLRSHWEPDVPVNGFEVENAHPRYQDARQAVDSGQFDVLVLTESVEIKDAIKYHDSPKYIRQWARAARAANPRSRVYLYETWHELNDPKGWLQRVDEDLGLYWEGVLLAQGLAHGDTGGPVYVIPAGQVMARLVREIETRGGVDRLRSREDLFFLNEKGERDMIHLSALGNYLVAMTHYAVLYHRPPPAEPLDLQLVDGTRLPPISPELAQLMSQVVWSVVTSYPKTGVAQNKR
ncbi:hypothetical protein ACVC7V_10490 [Hydrogenophaga sp. A37]|nr:hypothetical protein B0E41_04960 [Hydrogenophaga sp. A37]